MTELTFSQSFENYYVTITAKEFQKVFAKSFQRRVCKNFNPKSKMVLQSLTKHPHFNWNSLVQFETNGTRNRVVILNLKIQLLKEKMCFG